MKRKMTSRTGLIELTIIVILLFTVGFMFLWKSGYFSESFLSRSNEKTPKNLSNNITKPSNQHVLATYGNLPLSFEANQGQTDARVNFISRGNGYQLVFDS